MARIDIEIEEYLDEVDTKYLIQELQKRKDLINFRLDIDLFQIPEFKNSDQLLKYIKKLLGLREWHDKDRIISEIKEL
jgi:hypothetical protein